MWWRAPSRCIVARYSNPTLMRSGSSALLRRQWFVVTGWKISLRASRQQASILQAPAGFNTPGASRLPSYLLHRPAGSTRCSTTGFDPELPSYVHLEALRARFAPSQAALDGSEEAAEADECWLTGHLREMARRERMHATARSPIIPAATRPSTRIVLCGTNM